MQHTTATTVLNMTEPTAEVLFRSTLDRKRTPPPVLPIQRLPRPVNPPPMTTIDEESYYREPATSVRALEGQLYLYSVASIFTSMLYFLEPAFSDTSIGSFLPSSPALALIAYISLLLTFRAGVRRIALSTNDEPSIVLGVSDQEQLLPPIEDADEYRLRGGKSIVVQGFTLLAAAALMHLPVHSLQRLSLGMGFGFAAWCTSTCLVGLLMWDAINRAYRAEVEEGEGWLWVGGYLTKE